MMDVSQPQINLKFGQSSKAAMIIYIIYIDTPSMFHPADAIIRGSKRTSCVCSACSSAPVLAAKIAGRKCIEF